ncbi:hypothetical protein R6Q59_024474 [Mikania micrantha]
MHKTFFSSSVLCEGGIMAEEENQIELKDEAPDLTLFEPTKKKKKKKVVMQDPSEDSVEHLVQKTDNLSVSEDLDPAFTGLKKKKKKQVSYVYTPHYPNGEDGNREGTDLQLQKLPWEGTDRDYTYEELLSRVFNKLREDNPELAGERRRTIMRPPQVLRGTKKTVFANFMDICKMLHRQQEHVMAFLLTELGTSGSLDEKQRLVVKGRFAPKNFEGILRRYANEYVICSSCKSSDTSIEKDKETRLFFLTCEKCGSERSVGQIKAGFVARVGRRKNVT